MLKINNNYFQKKKINKMKFILVLIIALAAINAQTDSDKIYETDFSDFVPYQTSTTSVVI